MEVRASLQKINPVSPSRSGVMCKSLVNLTFHFDGLGERWRAWTVARVCLPGRRALLPKGYIINLLWRKSRKNKSYVEITRNNTRSYFGSCLCGPKTLHLEVSILSFQARERVKANYLWSKATKMQASETPSR